MSLAKTETTSSPDIDVRPLAYVLTYMHPDLSAPILTGESWDDMRARRAAAADILDDLLTEAADELADAEAVIW
ncbi:hypothetical protein ACIBCT_31505 [Streptosporangium sp. NPDC050855]|uniref:hypothetical protein n=1 Tax=Streptosporangium sp. NPDC050855 TaxID=3366194 RepID=UPI0037B9F78C